MKNKIKTSENSQPKGGTVVLLDTVWSCQLAGCYSQT